ncbi:MAG: methyltransferase domain-containing protein [Deltaproteobacteria bacterium]|nr:MAG: methyltransferase domain-containing protein [Deltaproteobacteria bacterium]
MFSFIYMKILESQPHRYDRGIAWLSLGAADRGRERMIASAVEPGDRVLDLGTGTGTLALLAAKVAEEVVGIDASAAMLRVAEEKRQADPNGGKVAFREAGVAELDTLFAEERFEVVTASLLFSELSEDEQRYTLRQAYRLLVFGGRLVIADETMPKGALRRFLYEIFRLPLALVTFLLTQTSTRPVIGIEEKVEEAGFSIASVERYNLGSYFILQARKETQR